MLKQPFQAILEHSKHYQYYTKHHLKEEDLMIPLSKTFKSTYKKDQIGYQQSSIMQYYSKFQENRILAKLNVNRVFKQFHFDLYNNNKKQYQQQLQYYSFISSEPFYKIHEIIRIFVNHHKFYLQRYIASSRKDALRSLFLVC